MGLQNLPIDLTHNLKKLEESLVNYLLTKNEPTNQVIRHIFSAGGKRLRPVFFILFSKLFDYEGEHLYPIASVCEYIHTASLLHDDVIDNSSVRRNKPTANSIWGDQTAVLVGDLIYSAACRLMVKTADLELIDSFAECIRLMSECELFQLDVLWKSGITKSDYFKIVDGKTAILFESSCKTAGLLAKEKREIIDAAAQFGRNLGIAFQISDDCLDLEGDSQELGKSVMADLVEGKVTLPFILGMENLSQQKDDSLKKLIEDVIESGNVSQEMTTALKRQLDRSQGLVAAKNMASEFLQKADEALAFILKNKSQESSRLAGECIKSIVPYILQRRV